MRKSRTSFEEVDLIDLICKVVEKIPHGKVCTFGDIALALGDLSAARAVGEVLASERRMIPHWYRVVYADGRAPEAEALRKEGVILRDGRVVDLERVRFKELEIPPLLKHLREEQMRLSLLVSEEDASSEFLYAAGVDVAYLEDEAVAAKVTVEFSTGKIVEEVVAWGKVRFPYIPGFLGYRELPLMKKVMEPQKECVHLIDGHGRLHPRGFGVACHAGVILGVPTIGAAKSLLPGQIQDEWGNVVINGCIKGRRVGNPQRPTFVSVGHMISLDTACGVVRRLILKGPPEPLRKAHILANEERKRRV
ncbi:MAG: endonuclease V [Methanomassiliicoccales archaeon]